MTSILTIDAVGNKKWENSSGSLHRLDGPALEWISGGKSWWVDGEPHRLDGPAVIWDNGDMEWWVRGNGCSTMFQQAANLTDDEMTILILKYGNNIP
jgi:hypothetical protein